MAKKKARQPNALQKAVMRACDIQTLAPGKTKDTIANIKMRYKELRQVLGMESPMSIPRFTRGGETLFRRCQADETLFASVVCRMVVGYWTANKVVYRIPDETLEFIHNKFLIKEAGYNINTLLLNACSSPIYLEFTGENTSVEGAFCSCTTLMQKGAKKLSIQDINECPSLFADILAKDERPYVFTFRTESCSVRKAVGNTQKELHDIKEEGRTVVMEVLAYIGWLLGHLDAKGTALMPESLQGGECYQVLPIPFEDSIPDLSQPSGWFRCGLCVFSDYLSRKNMIENACAQLKAGHWTPDTPVRRLDASSLEQATYAATLAWEKSKVIYQYDEETRAVLYNKYLESIMLDGIGTELMEFLPHNVMVFAPSGSWDVALAAKCKLEESDVPGIFMLIINGTGAFCAAFPCNQSPLSGLIRETGPQSSKQFADALCVMYHILSVMRHKTLKRWEKEDRGGENSQERPSLHIDTATKETGPVREGYAIPIQLYDLTARTVKKVSDDETLRRSGWKMVPHVRRRHPHRYWVGTGGNRHLEVRWLEDMHIHGDEEQENPTSVVIHPVKC